ncbi:ABC transporter substrate-binding protein [Actinomadura sp. SCN-SB]|uniref:ABC transporter substrate-binding protein n=1 Tax=Actinomadura sp. SCN-SB TaxID=3373092 RepID=UPI0037508601
MRKPLSLLCISLLAGVLMACGGTPTSGPTGGGTADEKLAAVLDQVKGLQGRQRADKLAQLAKDAGGTVSIYTALTNKVAGEVQKRFQQRYGLKLTVYRASTEAISRRLVQEVMARKPGADVVESGGTELVELGDQGVLAVYDSPERQALHDAAKPSTTWTGTRFQVYEPAWNTEQVTSPPKSWEELADPKWNGRLAMEPNNSDWYMTLSEHWLQQGKSQAEVDKLWRDIAEGTVMVSGHSTMRELLGVGEYGAVAALPTYMTEESMEAGLPLAWKPTVSPAIVRAQGAGVVKNSPNPAGALLLMDWLLAKDGGQQIFVDAHIDPARADMSKLDMSTVKVIDLKRYVAESKRWQDAFEKVTRLGTVAGRK